MGPSTEVSCIVHTEHRRLSTAVRAGDELQPRGYLRRLGLDWQWQVHDGGGLRLHPQHDWCVQPHLGGPICGLPSNNDECYHSASRALNPNIRNGTATANASASATVRSISVCTLAAATDHTAGVGADRLLRNRLLASVHASTIDLFRKLTTQTCDKTTPASCSSVAIRHCSKVASHGYLAAMRQVVLCTSATMPTCPFNVELARVGGVVVLSGKPEQTAKYDRRFACHSCMLPCGVLQCGCSHVS